MKKHLKHSNFLFFWKKFLVCLFPINIRDFKPKKAFFFAKNKAKMVENRQTQKTFWKTDKVNTFV